jgi:hypothetical protein
MERAHDEHPFVRGHVILETFQQRNLHPLRQIDFSSLTLTLFPEPDNFAANPAKTW